MASERSIVTERDLACTFDGGQYQNAWAVVEQYRRATDYAMRNECGSGATASALDLPRARLRTWIDDGGAPDPVRAIDVARQYDWLGLDYTDTTFVALNALVANVFSGGSISSVNYRPSFALNRNGRHSHVVDALDATGIDYQFVHEDTDDRATEVRPTQHSTVLGRLLTALEAPVGPKAELSDLSLPTYLDDAPASARETFVCSYLANRALHHPNKDTVQIREARPEPYCAELASLIEATAGERVTADGQVVTVSAAASRSLGLASPH